MNLPILRTLGLALVTVLAAGCASKSAPSAVGAIPAADSINATGTVGVGAITQSGPSASEAIPPGGTVPSATVTSPRATDADVNADAPATATDTDTDTATANATAMLQRDAVAGGGSTHLADDAGFRLTVLHINDHHSQLDAVRQTLQLATASGRREPIELDSGGFARVAQAIEEISAARPHVLKIHAGDAITGDLYYNLTQGRADAAMMNAVCFDTFTLGNHEFDYGDAGVKSFMQYLHNGPCSTSVLSANVRFGPQSPLHDAFADGSVRSRVVLQRGGQAVGLVGITIARKTQQSSRPDAGTHFLDEHAVAQAEINALRNSGVNKIILQTHVGYHNDLALAQTLSGVDVIVGGDSHTLLGPRSLQQYGISPSGPYPTVVRNADGDRVCVVQAFQYNQVLGELNVVFDDQGKVKHCAGTAHLLVDEPFTRKNQPLDPADHAAVLADLTSSDVFRVTPPSPSAVATLRPFHEQKQQFGAAVVAQTTSPLCQRRIPGNIVPPARSPLDAACNRDPHVIAHGGDMQQLVAQAMLQQGAQYFGAQIAIQNAGGVRVALPAGPITVNDVYTVLPFRNELVQVQATGAQLKQVLEDALNAILSRRATGSYPYAAGLRWQVDFTRPRGSRVSNLEVLSTDGAWQPIQLDAIYNVATIGYLADGKDDYTTFASITGERRVDVGLPQAEAFLEYLKSLPDTPPLLQRPDSASFSTQKFTGPLL